jgi:hypothetical protein
MANMVRGSSLWDGDLSGWDVQSVIRSDNFGEVRPDARTARPLTLDGCRHARRPSAQLSASSYYPHFRANECNGYCYREDVVGKTDWWERGAIGDSGHGGKCGWNGCSACPECECWRMGGLADDYSYSGASYGYSYEGDHGGGPMYPCNHAAVGPKGVNAGTTVGKTWTGDGWE